MRIIDITRPISTHSAVWPGDALPELDWSARLSEGSSVNIGLIRISTHTATHVDAPLHYLPGGHAVDSYDLATFIGPALVWSAPDAAIIRPEHVGDLPAVERLLVRTAASERPDTEWSDDFPSFAPETIDALADRGLRLIGTDAPSYDPADSKDLPAHHRIAARRIANLENLVLKDAPDGEYLLVAMPLKLAGMDAAPLRAVLLSDTADLHINVTGGS